MKCLVLFLVLGLAATEKLDRTYLPPPGSVYAGGEPGDLQVPLEFTKDAYTTTAPITPGRQNDGLTIGDTQLVPGFVRKPGQAFPGLEDIVPVNKPFNYIQNKLPTTTTSYAFTQTTTFPPSESFETTASPLFPIDRSSGEPTGFINQPFNQGLIIDQQTGQIRPGFVQSGNKFSQRPGFLPNSNVSGVTTSFPGSQTVGQSGHTQAQVAQHINQIQQGVPVSTMSPIPGSSYQPGLVTSFPYEQGYAQHLGVQPPYPINQQDFFPSSTAAPNYQTGIPSQIDNVQSSQVFGQQSPAFPTAGITQYIDKYGNVQSTAVPGLTVPQQIQPGQGSVPQSGLPQYGGDLNSIPGTSGSVISSQQGDQRLVSNELQRPFSSIARPQETIINGLIPNQVQGTQLPQIFGQREAYQTSDLSQGTKYIPISAGIQQQGGRSPQFSAEQGYLPGQEGLISGQGNQQNILSPSGTYQGSNPVLQQNLSGQQPQTINQQGSYPSTVLPGQVPLNQQGGQPQKGTPLPGQITFQQPSGPQPQISGQQGSFSSTEPPQSTISGHTSSQLGGQQPQIIQQSFPSTGNNGLPAKSPSGFYQPGDLNNIQDSITTPGSNALPGRQQVSGILPGTLQGSVPFGQTQTIDSRIPSQQYITPRPGDQSIITSGPQNIYRPGPTGTFSSSTTPSSIQFYGTTPSINYPSSTPAYPDINSGGTFSTNERLRPERPQAESDRNAVILNYENILTPEGFAYSFDTSNGIHADENGTAIDGVKANGSYSYVGDDGKLYSISYTADENGFRPHGDHLPTPPPIPKAIQRVIEKATREKEAGISHDGFYNEAKYGDKKYHGFKHRRPELHATNINGADIPDAYKISDDEILIKNKFGRKKEEKHVMATDDDDNRYGDNDDIAEMNEDIKIQSESNRKTLSGRPTTKMPGKFVYKDENDESLLIGINKRPQQKNTEQRTEQKRPFSSDLDSPRRRPTSSGRKKIPVMPEDQIYKDEESLEESEGAQESYDKDRVIPNKYSSRRFDPKQTSVEKTHGGKRPGSSSTRFEESSYDKQTVGKGTRPQKPVKGPSKISGTKYYVSDDDRLKEQEDYQEPDLSDRNERHKGIKKIGSPEQINKQQPGSYSQESTSDDTSNPKSSRFEQKIQPSYDQRAEDTDSKYPEQSYDEETGYQYNPPQNKFDQKETNRFPSRFSEKTTPKSSYQKYNTSDTKTTVQPFMTPNVHRDDDESYEDVSEENVPSRKPGKAFGKVTVTSTTPEYETIENSSEFFDKESESDQYIDEKITSSKDRPSRPEKTGSNRRPGQQFQQTTSQPQYYDEYTSEEEERVRQQGSNRPGQNVRYPSDSEKQNMSGRPGQDYSQQSRVPSRKPGFTFVSSTTPMSSRKGYRPLQKEEKQVQYPTTYEPSDTSTTEEEYTEEMAEDEIATTKPGSRKPVTTSGDFSYTTALAAKDQPASTKISYYRPTSRPSYDYSDKTTITGSPTIRLGNSESAFDRRRPSMRPGSSSKLGYSTTASVSETSSPDSTALNRLDSPVDKYYNKNKTGSATFSSVSSTPESNYPDKTISGAIAARPSTSLSQSENQDLPSTTYRPNYSITDISRPGSVTIDTFGRPSQPEKGRPTTAGTTTYVPAFSVSPGQETPSTEQPSNVYQDFRVIRPGQSSGQDTFKHTEPRFGGPTQGIAGQKPAEFGPSSVTTPRYLSPYGSSGRVIGEDFSGPKQSQKYDPATGYYY